MSDEISSSPKSDCAHACLSAVLTRCSIVSILASNVSRSQNLSRAHDFISDSTDFLLIVCLHLFKKSVNQLNGPLADLSSSICFAISLPIPFIAINHN
jgi:hypothetical protein